MTQKFNCNLTWRKLEKFVGFSRRRIDFKKSKHFNVVRMSYLILNEAERVMDMAFEL